jgi:integrase
MQCAALIMLYAGLRRGEVLALTRDDLIGVYKHYKRITRFENRIISFEIQSLFFGSEIRVDKSIRFNGNTPEIQLPKTKAGIRNVPMLSILQPYLRKPKQQIIGNASGKVMTEQSFSRCWESYILHLSKAAGHPVNIRPHDLRHTYCTMLRDAGVDMHQAMLWLGHADEKMILHVYDHINEKRTQNSINQVEKTLSGSQFGSQTDEEQ